MPKIQYTSKGRSLLLCRLTTVFGTARFLNVRTKRQVTPFPIYRFSTTALSETRPWNKNAAKIIQIPHSKALEWKIIFNQNRMFLAKSTRFDKVHHVLYVFAKITIKIEYYNSLHLSQVKFQIFIPFSPLFRPVLLHL